MTPRTDLARLQFQAQRDIDALYRPLPGRIGASVRQHAVATPDGPRITQAARTAILRDVDRVLSTIYPQRRGAPSRLQAMIERRCFEAERLPVAEAVAVMRQYVPDGLRERMGDRG